MYVGSRIDRVSPSRIAKSRNCICPRLSLKPGKNWRLGGQLREVLASSPLLAHDCSCIWSLQLDRHLLGQTKYGHLPCVINIYHNLIYPNASTGVRKEIQFPKKGGERSEEHVAVMKKWMSIPVVTVPAQI